MTTKTNLAAYWREFASELRDHLAWLEREGAAHIHTVADTERSIRQLRARISEFDDLIAKQTTPDS